MIEARLRSKISAAELEEKKGKILTDKDYNLLLTGPSYLRKPDGRPLAVYLPGALRHEMDDAYPTLQRIKMMTDNRGLASGTKRVSAGGTRTRAMPVHSAIAGAMEGIPRNPECRLTAFTNDHLDKWERLHPLLQAMSEHFRVNVPDRHAAQTAACGQTHPDWVVPGTVFTTVTVNNTYATGVHTDSGDLDAGFSCLAVGRRGDWRGGVLTFPEYRVAVDMQHGDLILMDAHEWHGNTALFCEHGQRKTGPCPECGAERISVVAYYRTKMTACSSLSEEDSKKRQRLEAKQAAGAAG